MDELDQLLTAKQDVVYNFFNWPTMRDSQLFVIAVANRMDLPQHLAAKIKSRLGARSLALLNALDSSLSMKGSKHCCSSHTTERRSSRSSNRDSSHIRGAKSSIRSFSQMRLRSPPQRWRGRTVMRDVSLTLAGELSLAGLSTNALIRI